MTPKQPGDPGYQHYWHRVVCDMPPATVSSEARQLAGAFMLYANEHGVCWPRRDTLAADLGVSERSVSRRSSELEQLGLIARSGGHRGRTTTCHLVLPRTLPPRTIDRLPQPQGDDPAGERVPPAASDRPERVTPEAEWGPSVSPRTPSESPSPEPSPPSRVEGEGRAHARNDPAPSAAEAERAGEWLTALLARLPGPVSERFGAEWDEIRRADPQARERGIRAVVRVQRTDSTGVLAEKVAARVLHPDGDATGRWQSAESVARVFLKRLHGACREVCAGRPAEEPGVRVQVDTGSFAFQRGVTVASRSQLGLPA